MREPDDLKIKDVAAQYAAAGKYIRAVYGEKRYILWDEAFFEHYPAMGKSITGAVEFACNKIKVPNPLLEGAIFEGNYI